MLGCIAAVIMRGAPAGIERVTRVLIPPAVSALVAGCSRSLTLPNAQAGPHVFFMPDFARINGDVVLMAIGLSFFKMSIGFGRMNTYGNYFRPIPTCPPAPAGDGLRSAGLSAEVRGRVPGGISFGLEPTIDLRPLFFDAYDFVSSTNLLLPVCGLLSNLFAGYVWPEREFAAVLTNNGALPLLAAVILLRGLRIF